MTRSDRFVTYPEPRISRLLFASKPMAVVWGLVRIYLGVQWLRSGLGKLGAPAWTGAEAGTAVAGFLRGALGRAEGEAPSVTAWYAWMIEHLFLPNATAMSYLVVAGEVLVGLALLVGLLTGVAAFMGGLMNAAFLLAGTLSSNPVMFILATWLVLAWRVAGWYGLDYWVLPALGAPRPAPGGPRRRAGSDAAV